MKISLIAALSKNNVIGQDGKVPWHLPDDLKWLKERIEGHHLLMGRKTFEEPQQQLQGQKTIVVTQNSAYNSKEATAVQSIEKGIAHAESQGEDELMVVGGGKIYEAALPYAHKLYLTIIDTEIEGDTFFPKYNALEWEEIYNHYHPKDQNHEYHFHFKILERKN